MREELEETIAHLREQLSDHENMGTAEAAELQKALEEISSSLDEHSVDSASLAKLFQDQTQAFQESHPVLTQTVGRLADMLSQMGI